MNCLCEAFDSDNIWIIFAILAVIALLCNNCGCAGANNTGCGCGCG